MKKNKCDKCSGKVIVEHVNYGSLCKACFCRMIEKRVRRFSRINKLFSKGDNILVLDDGSKEFFVNDFLLQSIIKNLPLTIGYFKICNVLDYCKNKSLMKIIKAKKINKIIVPLDLDDVCVDFLNRFMKKNFKFVKAKKEVILLRNVSDKEVEMFAKFNGFRYKKKKSAKDRVGEFLDMLEEKHAETKFSLGKSIGELEKVSNLFIS